jgi:hypothetical protein
MRHGGQRIGKAFYYSFFAGVPFQNLCVQVQEVSGTRISMSFFVPLVIRVNDGRVVTY